MPSCAIIQKIGQEINQQTMSKINYDLTLIKGIVFDVDGVLSPSTIPLGEDGMPIRMVNIKDGYALQLAAKAGYKLAIITGADSQAISLRYKALGITDIFQKASKKLPIFISWMESCGLTPDQVVFVGDDVPDICCLEAAGLSVVPADACADAKAIAQYISPITGGYGVARDIIEEIMRNNGQWMSDTEAFGW